MHICLTVFYAFLTSLDLNRPSKVLQNPSKSCVQTTGLYKQQIRPFPSIIVFLILQSCLKLSRERERERARVEDV